MSLTPVEHGALRCIANGVAVERSVRRRLIRLGMIDKHNNLMPDALAEFEARAPRSKWEPPRHQGPTQDPFPRPPRTSTHPSLMLASMLMMMPAVRDR